MFGFFFFVILLFVCLFVFFLCKFAVAKQVAKQALGEVNDFIGLLAYFNVILLPRMAV